MIYSIVLLDLSMPVLDGMRTVTIIMLGTEIWPVNVGVGATIEVRQIEASRLDNTPTRILALTGMSSLEDKRRAFEAGVDG